jgi:hypothetical protein
MHNFHNYQKITEKKTNMTNPVFSEEISDDGNINSDPDKDPPPLTKNIMCLLNTEKIISWIRLST